MKAGINYFALATALLLFVSKPTHAANFSVLHSFGVQSNITGFYTQAPLTQGPDGTLYGINTGAESGSGVIFRVNPDGTGFQNLHSFTNSDGASAYGGMVLVGDTLYGTTSLGGAYTNGVIFSINTNGSGFTKLYDFGAVTNDGLQPYGTLNFSGGVLYGTTMGGGPYNLGTVFSISTNGGPPSYLVNFNLTNGSYPFAGVVSCGDTLYGGASLGGNPPYAGYGVLFKVNTDGSGFAPMHIFDSTNGSRPFGELVLSGNLLYGTAAFGGLGGTGNGTVFSINTEDFTYTNLYSFSAYPPGSQTNSDGSFPRGLTLVSNTLYGISFSGGAYGDGTIFQLGTNGSNFLTMHNFMPTNGTEVYHALLNYSNSLLGAAYQGAYGFGCLFSIDTDGSNYINFFNFPYGDGLDPAPQLLATNGILYGTTASGGLSDYGTVFAIATNGTGYTNLHSFNGYDCGDPGSMVLLGNTLYGPLSSGFIRNEAGNTAGGLFSINTDGSSFSNLYIFPANSDYSGGSALASDGVALFGNVNSFESSGVFSIGTNGQNPTVLLSFLGLCGPPMVSGNIIYSLSGLSDILYSANTNGSNYQVLHTFSGTDGSEPLFPPLLVGDTLYGSATEGGAYGNGTVFSINTNGSNFIVLHQFTGGTGGALPHGSLVLLNGALYGTTSKGGNANLGTIYSLNPDGSGFAVQYSFSGTDGAFPTAGLAVSGNSLFGTTFEGGDLGNGVVFAITPQPVLSVQSSGNSIILFWSDPTYSLQSAPSPVGPYTTIPSAISPYTNVLSAAQQYFRLISN